MRRRKQQMVALEKTYKMMTMRMKPIMMARNQKIDRLSGSTHGRPI